jgi:hypothetical protein
MGWACGAYGWGEGGGCIGFWWGNRREGNNWGDLGVDNIRMDLKEVGCGYMDWIGLAQDRDRWRTLVNAVMNLRVPWNAVNFLTSCKPVRFSRMTLHRGVSNYSKRLLGYVQSSSRRTLQTNDCEQLNIFPKRRDENAHKCNNVHEATDYQHWTRTSELQSTCS